MANLKQKIATDITNKTEINSVTNTKVGQLMTDVLMETRVAGLSLKIKAKGFNQDDIQNQSYDLEVGDLVTGWFDSNTFWESAMYLGIDPNVKDNYSPGIETDYSESRGNITYP